MENLPVLPEPIARQIAVAGLQDLSMAEKIASNFVPFMGEVQEQIELLKPLEKGNPEHVELARRISLDLGKIRSRKDDIKKEQKEHYLKVGRFIDALSNTVEGMITLTQDEAKDHAKFFENQEKERLEKLKQERIELISPYMEVTPVGLDLIDSITFDLMFAGAKATHQMKLDAIKKAEEDRLENERLLLLVSDRNNKIAPYSEFIEDGIRLNLRDLSQTEFEALLQSFVDKKTAKDLVKAKEEELKRVANERHIELAPYRLFFKEAISLIGISDKDYKNYLKLVKGRKADHDAELLRIEKENERLKLANQKLEEDKKKEADRLNLQHSRMRKLISVGHLEEKESFFELTEEAFDSLYQGYKKIQDEKLATQAFIARELELEKQRKLDEQKESDRKALALEDEKRKSALAPDKEKLRKMIVEINVPHLDLNTEEGIELYSELIKKLASYKKWASEQINNLL